MWVQVERKGLTRAGKAQLSHRQGQGLVHRHVLLSKGMEDPFSQSDRLSRLRLELWQGAGGWWGYRPQGSVFQLGKVLEEAQTRKNNALVVFYLHDMRFPLRKARRKAACTKTQKEFQKFCARRTTLASLQRVHAETTVTLYCSIYQP